MDKKEEARERKTYVGRRAKKEGSRQSKREIGKEIAAAQHSVFAIFSFLWLLFSVDFPCCPKALQQQQQQAPATVAAAAAVNISY